MARYTAEQIYAFAREAGFAPDRAATMTAIALAESGGNSGAHNSHGEDSKGLWQINARAHPGLGQADLFDPVENAKAAFAVSHGGDDISPWTTTHGDLSARYLRFRAQAEAAAAAYGDGSGRGMWTGTSGYGDHTSAGDGKGGHQPAPSHASSTAASGSDNVNVTHSATTHAPQAAEAHPGARYGIAMDTDSGPSDGTGGSHAAHPGRAYGIPMDSGQPPTETPVSTMAHTTPADPVAPAAHAGREYSIPMDGQQTPAAPVSAMTRTPSTDSGAAATHTGREYGIPVDGQQTPPATPAPVSAMTHTPGTDSGAPATHSGRAYGIPVDGQQPPAATPAPAAPVSAMTQIAAVAPTAPTAAATTGDSAKLQQFLSSAVAQTGDQYVFGAETNLNDPNPSRFDCSELVEWASHQVGVQVPDGAYNQYSFLNKGGHTLSVEQAINTPGALLFSFSSDPSTGQPKAAHVAISLGNGKTIEAKGTEYGVGSWEANSKRFQYAAVIPEFAGATGVAPTAAPTQAAPVDAFSYRLNHDPVNMDNHPATLAVSYQLTDSTPHIPMDTEPEPAPEPVIRSTGDADQDGIDDALELAKQYAIQSDGHPDDGPRHADHFDDHHDSPHGH